jgi:hypothetical protein
MTRTARASDWRSAAQASDPPRSSRTPLRRPSRLGRLGASVVAVRSFAACRPGWNSPVRGVSRGFGFGGAAIRERLGGSRFVDRSLPAPSTGAAASPEDRFSASRCPLWRVLALLVLAAGVVCWWILPGAVDEPEGGRCPSGNGGTTFAPPVGKLAGQFPNDGFHRQRAYPERTFEPQAVVLALEQARSRRASRELREGGAGTPRSSWERAGPINIGGRITAVAAHPSAPGMPFVVVHDLVLHAPTRTLVAFTHGRSCYRLQLPAPSTVPAFPPARPREALVFRAAPNPFTATTTLTFRIPGDPRARLQIVDVGGRVLRTLRTGTGAASAGEIVFDGRDGRGRSLPAGTYFARLATAHGSITRSLTRIL